MQYLHTLLSLVQEVPDIGPADSTIKWTHME